MISAVSLVSAQTKAIPIEDVDQFLFQGNGELVIQQGSSSEVVLEGSEKELQGASVFISDHMLVVKEKRGFLDFFRSRPSNLKCTVTLQDLTSLTLEGGSRVKIDGFKVHDLTAIVRDNAELNMDIQGNSLALYLIRDGEVTASGHVGNQNILISDGGLYRASDLSSEACEIVLEGSGVAYVQATETLDATITSSGVINYSGSPRKIQSNITGTGQLLLKQ